MSKMVWPGVSAVVKISSGPSCELYTMASIILNTKDVNFILLEDEQVGKTLLTKLGSDLTQILE